MKKRINKFYFVILLFLLSFLILFLSFIFSQKTVYEKEIPLKLEIGENGGLDLNLTTLSFGTITPSINYKRELIIENDYLFPLLFEFDVTGDIKNFLIYDDKIYLESGEIKKVTITAFSFSDEEKGNYSGKMIITAKKIRDN
jgi:hypothetical protein